MPDQSDFEPGSVLGRFGFSVEGEPKKKTAEPKEAPSASSGSPGSVLSRFGFDAEGNSLSPSERPIPENPEDSVETRAKQLAKRESFTNSMVEGMPIVGPLMQKAEAAGSAAVRPLIGADSRGKSFGERYSEELAAERRSRELYRSEHPVSSVAGNVLGAGFVTTPLAATALGGRALGTIGSTLGARVYGGIAGGGAIGATDAALRGEDPLKGGTIGAVLGGAGPLVGEAVGRGITSVANALRTPPAPLAGVNPIARDWLSGAMANETPASIAAARDRMGREGFAADINPSMTELAAGMATRAEPPASADIGEAYRLRQAQHPAVTETALNRAMGPRTNIEDFRDMITENRAAAADPLYQQWRSMQVHPTQALKDMMPTLERLGLTRDAESHALMRNVAFDRDFFTPGQRKNFPTTESWDMIKRAIDGRIETAYGAGNRTLAADLTGLKNRMIGEIEQTPAGQVWRRARSEFADRSEIINQIDAGKDTFLGSRSGLSPDQLREELRGLSGPELQARIVGMRSAADEVMGATRNGDTTLRNKFLAPNNQEKLRLMLGDNRANDLIRTIEQQDYLSRQAQYVNPRAGSPTAPRTQAANRLEAPPLGHWDPSISRPLSWLPPSWIDALRPGTVLQGGRNASYAGARQQLAPVLLTREGPELNQLLDALQAENVGRAGATTLGNVGRGAATGAITGPGAGETRRRVKKLPDVRGALSAPAL